MDNKFIYAQNLYGKYAIPVSSKDRPAAQSILKGDIWESKTIEFILNQNIDGDIIHAGTYFGDFLPALSKHNPNSKIYAFEGSKNSFEAASETIKINELYNVVLSHKILGDTNEKVNFLVSSDNQEDLGGVSSKVKNESQHTITVEQVSLDKFIGLEKKVGLIQLDIEGEELDAIKGSENLIRKYRPILILERNKKLDSSEWFISFLNELGYQYINEIHGNLIYKV